MVSDQTSKGVAVFLETLQRQLLPPRATPVIVGAWEGPNWV